MVLFNVIRLLELNDTLLMSFNNLVNNTFW